MSFLFTLLKRFILVLWNFRNLKTFHWKVKGYIFIFEKGKWQETTSDSLVVTCIQWTMRNFILYLKDYFKITGPILNL